MATLFLPLKFRYTLNRSRCIIVESVRQGFPESIVYEFQVDDKPIKNHPVISDHLEKSNIDLAAEGKPNSGWIDLQLGKDLVSLESKQIRKVFPVGKSLTLSFHPTQCVYWSVEKQRFHFNGEFLQPDPQFGPVGLYSEVQNPTEFVKLFMAKYGSGTQAENISKFIALVPEDVKLELVDLSMTGSLKDLTTLFCERYANRHKQEIQRLLVLRWTSDSNMQLYFEQKLQAYKAMNMSFRTIMNMLRSELGEQARLLDVYDPKNQSDLKKVAALYDKAQSMKLIERFRTEAASRFRPGRVGYRRDRSGRSCGGWRWSKRAESWRTGRAS